MIQTVIMPKLGQTVEESTIVKWHKKVGDKVAKGDVIFEIETDKAVLEVESFFEGTLLAIVVKEGETVPVTATVGFIGKPGDPIPTVVPVAKPAAAAAAAPAAATAASPAARPAHAAPSSAPAPAIPTAPAAPRRKAVSPRARRLARESAIGADPIPGTGSGGRVTEKDVRAYLEAKGYASLSISPAAKALAIQEGIDLLTLERESANDRITVERIRQALAERPKEMSKMRQVIAQRLAQSVVTAPHFYVTVAVDMTDLLAYRQELKAQEKACSVTAFILKACAIALAEFPAVNSVTDGRAVRWRAKTNIGMAVDIKEGLVVPVIRNAQTLGLADLNDRAAQLAIKARDGKLTPDEMSGSTFTVSNMGMLGVECFTAIINPGESAILAVASTVPTPVVRRDQITVRQIMKITLSSDHRIVDGAMAARFVNRIKNLLEDVESWKRMI